jgi:lysophospholipase L1-like esterase
MWRRRPWKLFYLFVLVAWFVALGAEILLRLDGRLHRAEVERYMREVMEPRDTSAILDREAIWQERYRSYRPNARLELSKDGETHTFSTNSLGFRTREFSSEKDPETLRVLCIGGSTTAQGRSNEETYPALLEKALRRRLPALRIEVLNLGISAVWSNHWLERQDFLFSLQPDVIVQYEGINDIAFVHLNAYGMAHPWRRRLNRSLLLQALFPFDPSALDAGFDATLQRLVRMRRRAREHGAEYVTASFATPDPRRLSTLQRRYLDFDVTRLWGRALGMRRYSDFRRLLDRYNERFERRMEQAGIAWVPLHRTLTSPGLFSDACHLSGEGTARLADALLPLVASAVERRSAARAAASPS